MNKFNPSQYINRNIDDIKKIRPLWAFEENIDCLLDKDLHPRNERYVIEQVTTIELIKYSDFKEVDIGTLYTGVNTNDFRISRILYAWENGIYLDPPTISIKSENKIVYSDGRHRAKVSYFLGLEKIPIAIEKDDLMKINVLLAF